MGYTYDGIRTILQSWDGNKARIIARLQPLSGGTHLQHFGYESEINRVSAIVVGDSDLDDLLDLFESSGVSYDLYYDATLAGTFFPRSISYSRIPTIAQTMRTDLDCTAPVYKVEMELYPDE